MFGYGLTHTHAHTHTHAYFVVKFLDNNYIKALAPSIKPVTFQNSFFKNVE